MHYVIISRQEKSYMCTLFVECHKIEFEVPFDSCFIDLVKKIKIEMESLGIPAIKEVRVSTADIWWVPLCWKVKSLIRKDGLRMDFGELKCMVDYENRKFSEGLEAMNAEKFDTAIRFLLESAERNPDLKKRVLIQVGYCNLRLLRPKNVIIRMNQILSSLDKSENEDKSLKQVFKIYSLALALFIDYNFCILNEMTVFNPAMELDECDKEIINPYELKTKDHLYLMEIFWKKFNALNLQSSRYIHWKRYLLLIMMTQHTLKDCSRFSCCLKCSNNIDSTITSRWNCDFEPFMRLPKTSYYNLYIENILKTLQKYPETQFQIPLCRYCETDVFHHFFQRPASQA